MLLFSQTLQWGNRTSLALIELTTVAATAALPRRQQTWFYMAADFSLQVVRQLPFEANRS